MSNRDPLCPPPTPPQHTRARSGHQTTPAGCAPAAGRPCSRPQSRTEGSRPRQALRTDTEPPVLTGVPPHRGDHVAPLFSPTSHGSPACGRGRDTRFWEAADGAAGGLVSGRRSPVRAGRRAGRSSHPCPDTRRRLGPHLTWRPAAPLPGLVQGTASSVWVTGCWLGRLSPPPPVRAAPMFSLTPGLRRKPGAGVGASRRDTTHRALFQNNWREPIRKSRRREAVTTCLLAEFHFLTRT